MLPTGSRIVMLGLLVYLVIKKILLIVPLTVAWLAIRRFLRWKSGNAWLYAVTAMFAGITSIGRTPWAFRFGASHWVFFAFPCMSPAVWVAVAILCNASRSVDYADDVEWAIGHLGDLKSFFRQPRASAYDEAALILSDPLWPDEPVLVFRHSRAMPMEEPCPRPDPRLLEDAQAQGISDTARKIIKVAKSMRRNPSSEPRRIKLLTPPRADSSADLPFLKSSRSA